mmetsp:Transcript_48340/g.90497  ORF Transcript_48340/g.90497 Transcript_48340/m.90497 type:complete len:348 (-) Transcript_48340:141-1184(-)
MDPELRFHSATRSQHGFPQHDKALVRKWDESMSHPSTRKEFTKLLKKIILFEQASDAFRHGLCDAVVPLEYAQGMTVFRQGEPGDWMCILLAGRLEKTIVRNPSSPAVVIGEIVPGGICGDMGVLGVMEHRAHSCQCAEDCSLLLLTRTAFNALVDMTGGLDEYPLLTHLEKMQNVAGDTDAFCSLPFFAKFERDFVKHICEYLEPRLYYPGMAVMKEGEMGFEMFIIHMGKVEVVKGSKRVAELSGGVVLGDVAVFGSDKRRTATVKCLELTMIYVLNGDVVHNTLDQYPQTKKVHDHDYIARLLKFELDKVSDEVEHLENFYGKCHPMPLEEVNREVFGRNLDVK